MNEQNVGDCCPVSSAEPDLRPVEGKEADEELAALAKAIGHPARVQIIRILVRKTTCVCGDIVDEVPLAQSTVSQHLKELHNAGLLDRHKRAQWVYYTINRKALEDVAGYLHEFSPHLVV